MPRRHKPSAPGMRAEMESKRQAMAAKSKAEAFDLALQESGLHDAPVGSAANQRQVEVRAGKVVSAKRPNPNNAFEQLAGRVNRHAPVLTRSEANAGALLAEIWAERMGLAGRAEFDAPLASVSGSSLLTGAESVSVRMINANNRWAYLMSHLPAPYPAIASALCECAVLHTSVSHPTCRTQGVALPHRDTVAPAVSHSPSRTQAVAPAVAPAVSHPDARTVSHPGKTGQSVALAQNLTGWRAQLARVARVRDPVAQNKRVKALCAHIIPHL